MHTTIIDGAAVARDVLESLTLEVAAFRERTGRQPGLATVLVGEDPASEVYVRNKRRSAERLGIADHHRHLPADTTQARLLEVIDELASDDAVSGILAQLPLPGGLDATTVIDRIPWYKDVDGLTTTSAGLLARARPGLRPCTPSGVITLLDSAGVEIAGREVVVVGRSELVGRPLAQLLLQRDATVTTVHSRTRNAREVTLRAEILVVAAGIPHLIGRDDTRAGATVIDVGIHRSAEGLIGDVRFEELLGHASHMTPVPGGVGPMTIAALMRNTLQAAMLGEAIA
ncbi:bifunctional 5,10-methylenetetrahydrofolate dehydrogenase/5,10-methenyltetrahydrofolate cyclohydrolase [Agreia sp. VKM Ac-1783]|uniref:bifunctional 5,10-methylenetetrahydrofolate dehydrogenase/5,10-methenyltetrahydrofolate cyclohydrolase n=1 Tax=Agreia sp. VKM Ac-1783 TaxID=1938889 RepID=UPI000A2AE8F5|nr:bifunctional 5,10-methylenetetrahydrofolate dehydrogenase/5,10-methenyltetrahydrofolate cyclohydrolase [Agreia sp. VKM Ac-1783]SMQ74786.1 methylenetetrahydrofolate dehydrogenase (NADP+) / methenyltetrahydrofolate cyclohydrolase [Agreia sp. VKM Ac-1783]